jgi:hypothetical protein
MAARLSFYCVRLHRLDVAQALICMSVHKEEKCQ